MDKFTHAFFMSMKKTYLWKNDMRGLTFSLKRAIGISGLKTKIARKTGIPTTKQGLERKIGQAVIKGVTGKRNK